MTAESISDAIKDHEAYLAVLDDPTTPVDHVGVIERDITATHDLVERHSEAAWEAHPILMAELAEINGRALVALSWWKKLVNPPREHWAVEQVKRHVIEAIVEHSRTGGMAVAARHAADKIIDLLVPGFNHRHLIEEEKANG